MAEPKPDFLRIIQTLRRHRVDFIVVGGVCAVLQGAPVATFDLDVVHSRAPENIDRILLALKGLDAHYRGQSGRILTPERSHLLSPGHQLLMTNAGPLDLLGEIGKGHCYDGLLSRTYELNAGEETTVRILNLDALIEIKEETAREKDRAVLAVLRRTLEEKLKH